MKIRELITFMGAFFASIMLFQRNPEEPATAFRGQSEGEIINQQFDAKLAHAMHERIPDKLNLEKYPLFCDVDEYSKQSLIYEKKLFTGDVPLKLVDQYFQAFGCEPLVAGGGAIDQVGGLIVTSKPKYPILGNVIQVLKDLPKDGVIGNALSEMGLNNLSDTPRVFLHKMADTLVTQFQRNTPIIFDSHSDQYGITVNDDDSYTLYNVDADMAPDMGMHFLFSKAFGDDFDLYSRFQIFYTIAEISYGVNLDDLVYDFFNQILNDQGQYWDRSVKSFFQGILDSDLPLENGKILVKGCEIHRDELDFIEESVIQASLLSKLPKMITDVNLACSDGSPSQLFVQDFAALIKDKTFDFKLIETLPDFPKGLFS